MRKTKEDKLMEEKEKLYPGDKGYQGGEFHSTVYIHGRAYDVKTVKDAYGNVVGVYESPKIFGIF